MVSCWLISTFITCAHCITKVGASHLDVDVDGVLGVVADHCPLVVEEEDNLNVPLQGRLQRLSLVHCC